MAGGEEGVTAEDVRGAVFIVFLKTRYFSGRGKGKTYVIRLAVRAWKISATEQSALERKLPMRLHRARRPRKSEHMAKKSPMSAKAKVKRER